MKMLFLRAPRISYGKYRCCYSCLRYHTVFVTMLQVLSREFVYLRFYFELQLVQIFRYWVLGIAIGSFIPVFSCRHPALRAVPALCAARPDGQCFRRKRGMGVLMAATVGVPLYACGGGTIPLLREWLMTGMSIGSAAAFMITGPATKITNLGALKIVLGVRRFLLYIGFVGIPSKQRFLFGVESEYGL